MSWTKMSMTGTPQGVEVVSEGTAGEPSAVATVAVTDGAETPVALSPVAINPLDAGLSAQAYANLK